MGRRGGRRTEVGGCAGLGAEACGWWEWGEGTQYHPPRPFNPAVLGGAVEPVPSSLSPILPLLTIHTTAGDDGPVCGVGVTHSALHTRTDQRTHLRQPWNLPARLSLRVFTT